MHRDHLAEAQLRELGHGRLPTDEVDHRHLIRCERHLGFPVGGPKVHVAGDQILTRVVVPVAAFEEEVSGPSEIDQKRTPMPN